MTETRTQPRWRLYVIAPTFQRFKAWCYDHGLSPRDPMLIAVLPIDWEHYIRGASDIRYVVADWMPSEPRMHGLWVRLEMHGTEMTPGELEAWVKERKASIA